MSTTVRDDRRLTICKNNNANTISRETVDYFLQNELVKTMVSARCRPGLTKPSDDITGKSDIVWGRSYWFPDPKWLLGSCLWAKYNPYSGNISHHLFPKDHGHLIFREVDGLSFFLGGDIFYAKGTVFIDYLQKGYTTALYRFDERVRKGYRRQTHKKTEERDTVSSG